MREPLLPARQSPKGDGGNETDALPRHRSRSLSRTELRSGAGLATQQKSFLCIFYFSCARFFLPKACWIAYRRLGAGRGLRPNFFWRTGYKTNEWRVGLGKIEIQKIYTA